MHTGAHDQAAFHTLLQQPAGFVVQAHAAARDRRRHGVFELHEPERQRVALFSRPSDVEMHVVERVHRANHVGCREPGAAFDAHADDGAAVVAGGDEPGIVERAAVPVAADAQVHVRDRADAHRFVQRAEVGDRYRRGDEAVANGPDRRSLIGVNVDARVKPLAALAAARLAHRAGDFMRTIHRIDRPQQRLPPERVGVESRIEARRRRRVESNPRRRGDDSHERVTRIGQDQPSGRRSGQRAEAAKARVRAGAVHEPRMRACDDSCAPIGPHLDYAAAIVGDEDFAGCDRHDARRPKQPIHQRRRDRRDRAGGRDGAHDAVAGVGDVDRSARVDRDA